MIASFMIVHSCVSLAAIPLFLFLPVCDWLGIVLSLLAYTRSLLLLILLLLLFCNCCFFVSSFSSSSSFLRSVCLSLSFSRALSLFFFFCFSRSLSPSLHLNRHRLSVCVCVCVCRRAEISFFHSCYHCCFYYCDKQREEEEESCSFCRVYATHITSVRMLIDSLSFIEIIIIIN